MFVQTMLRILYNKSIMNVEETGLESEGLRTIGKKNEKETWI